MAASEMKSRALALGDAAVQWGNCITIDKLFRGRALAQNEFDALAALAFNIGENAFADYAGRP